MNKNRLYVYLMFVIAFAFQTYAQSGKTATLSAQIYGYKQDMVYFDCVQTPLIRQEFYTNPGEEHIYSFETESLVCMLINGKNRVLLQPGDSLHVELRYEGRNVQMTFSGNDEVVRQNRLYQSIDFIKRDLRYKSQLLGCAALDIKPKDRIQDSRVLMQRVQDLFAKPENKLPDAVANYIMAEIESDAYMSFIEYPVMYASVRKLPIEQQEIGDYWSIMDGYKPHNDDASLSNPSYIGFLMRYCFYEKEKDARKQGATYQIPVRFESMYQELADFYADAPRDAVLYNLICNFIRTGKEIERVDPIIKDYKEKYNKNSQYTQILDSLLQ